tara:strand:- start:57 stop:218 length:162 start_codon:yes stop_codon:yes gene_type:complete
MIIANTNEIKSKLAVTIELKNSIGNKFPTNILVLKSILGKNNSPETNALKIEK